MTLFSHQHGVIFNISLVATSLLFVGLELERQPISKLLWSRDIVEPTWRRRHLPVESVTDFDNNEYGERHRLGMRVVEDLTVDTREHARLGRTLHVMRLTDRQTHPRHIARYLLVVVAI